MNMEHLDKDTASTLEEMIEKIILIGNPDKDILEHIVSYAYMAGKTQGYAEANAIYEGGFNSCLQ